MLDAIKPLIDSGLINEDVAGELKTAFDTKLMEAKDQVRGELRNEFAQRYEHDRSVMVEALDKMVTESLSEEIKEFHEEKTAINEDRVKAKLKLKESATKFNNFMVTKLAEEIRELRTDRKVQLENQDKLQKFIVHALAKEIKEFAQDRQAVVEQRVKLVAEGRKQLTALKSKFIAESSKRVGATVATHLKGELSQLKEDIKTARENSFGRKIFETFAGEFSTTYLNDKAETRKIVNVLNDKEQELAESMVKLAKANQIIESKEREVNIIKESTQREKELVKLTASLNNEKAQVMRSLLESVQSDKLKNAFDKYLPAVLNEGSEKARKSSLTESVSTVVDGNKSAKKEQYVEEDYDAGSNVIDLKRLAGL
jgi:hypothetical protein|tara:strand:+ start:523 stop:1632 length:1110 start_codon:yes stop_codon:yes gene_type:complete